MHPDVFEVLASEDQAEQERVSSSRAKEAAKVRVAHQLGAYVRLAKTSAEASSRIDQVSGRLTDIVASVCEEYGAADPNAVLAVAIQELHLAGGHASGCTCGFCKNKGKGFGPKDEDNDGDSEEDDEKEIEKEDKVASTHCGCDHCAQCSDSACCGDCPCVNDGKGKTLSRVDEQNMLWHTAAGEVEDGDSFTQERVDLPTSDGTGLGDTGAVPTDKSRVPADGLKPVDVPSAKNPSEEQSVTELTREDRLENGTGDPNPAQGTRKQIDADKGLQPEHNVADHTDTWNGTEGLADPVTRETITSKWRIV